MVKNVNYKIKIMFTSTSMYVYNLFIIKRWKWVLGKIEKYDNPEEKYLSILLE